MSNTNSNISDKIRNIEIQVDTVSNVNYTTYGYAALDSNVVHLRHNTENEFVNIAVKSPAVIQHEQKHLDNYNNGMFAYALNMDQAYKISMWDEISANMTALIALRDEYVKTGDINVFDAEGEKFSFYKNAIIKGEIKPNSPYKEDFDNEMRLIVNGTKDMWEKQYGEMYAEQCYAQSVSNYDWAGNKKEHYNDNYLRARNIACNIGGVDFTKYLTEDVDIPQKGKEKLDTYNEKRNFRSIANDKTILEKAKQRLKYLRDSVYSSLHIATDNTPINKVNYEKKFDAWSKEHRVSPVQHRQILDMNNDIIQKPTKSYANEGKNTNKQKTTLKNASQHKISGVKILQNDYLEQKPSTIQPNKPTKSVLSSSARHLNLQSSTLKTKIKDDNQKVHKIINGLNIKGITNYIEERQKSVNGFLDDNWKKMQSKIDKRCNTQISGNKGKTQEIKEQIQKDKHSADNKYQKQMIAMIQNMNKINGPQKSIDAQKTTDILYQKYGDNAYNLLLKAIQKPTDYSQITGDSNIKTSRAAVQHLLALENNEKTQKIINNLLRNRER